LEDEGGAHGKDKFTTLEEEEEREEEDFNTKAQRTRRTLKITIFKEKREN
jgi:hypothetical protein